jgi:transformation/transcription domain-associated protein
VLNVVCADKPDAWYTTNAKVLQKLVQTGMQTDETSLQDSLHPILDRLVRLFPLPQGDEEPQGEMADFHTFLINAITEGLRNMSALKGTLMILKSVVTITPERIEPFAPTLMKIFNKYAKDHIAALAQPNQQAADTEVAVRWLISIIELCQMTPAFPADQRRMLYSTIQLLAEKSHSKELCEFLLKTAKELALKRKEPYPTMKEKAALLLKMTAFESRPDPLPKQYLEMIYEVYTDPTLRRSDLTARLEPAFLIGCRARDNVLREKFTDLLDSSIQRSLMNRLMYVLSVQSWDPISDANWIFLALDLILSSVDGEELWTSAPNVVFTQTASPLAEMIANSRVRNIMRPLRRLLFVDVQTAHETWVSVFSAIWSSLSRKEQVDVSHSLVVLLSKDYLIKQTDLRPNVVQTLVEGIHACSPPMSLPPHLLKYLAKTFGAWHVTMEYLQESLGQIRDDDGSIRDSIYDALAEVYAELSEEDMFYGLWRRRALHPDTNIGLAYEQIGMWQEAQVAYETAQVKLKNGVIPFTESEYCLWEDHWITAAEKLQQWDYLYELARQDGNQDLLLEAAWRNRDWSDKETKEFIEEQLQTQNDVATPRRRIYEAFLALIKLPGAVERNTEFTRILEDAMQLSLRKWVGLPNRMSTAHIQLLQHFQQFVELQEAVQIFGSLSVTNAQNLERKSSDLKLVLQAWRERLPNLHDDISVWSDLVAWRQNVFNAINRQYIPLISANAQGGQQANNSGTYGYRGYHETAWIINRFAHVARKHDLLDVAHASLIRIYQLPNIEISEAFLKLREEARCHLQVPEKLNEGLTLINNTNLTYFSNMQKAEFYTLKGMFYSSLGQNEEASDCFGQAVQLDMNLPKAWAEWGRFNDKIHKDANNLENAANAVSCYLQAAGLFKSAKSRPLLTRVLWLLSNDDSNYQVGRAFDTYQGDSALWYWITLIPQLILSLACREAKQARHILLALARHHPQVSFRTFP